MRTAPLAVALFTTSLCAQSNVIPGTDLRIYDLAGVSVAGRTGAAYPNGDAGVMIGHSYCNAGSVQVPWVATSGGVMVDTYPRIAYLLARESGGRMVQVSNRGHVKHSTAVFNFSSGPCAPCSGGSGVMGIGCSDTYGPSTNGSQINLGPCTEINPWLGSWNPLGSLFDRGDPAVAGAAATDRVKSLTSSMISAYGPVKHRIECRETDLATPGTFWGQAQVVIKGEPVENRANNLQAKQMSFTWSGSSWSASQIGSSSNGSVLTHWTGATWNLAGNGVDDGRFLVATKVTQTAPDVWHYEYAVHNIDNDRGGVRLRIPASAGVQVTNVGFHDVDAVAANDWSFSRTNSEILFGAGAENSLDWNNLYNFWFDCSVAPLPGAVEMDQARVGPGALFVSIPAEVPGAIPPASVAVLGSGCGGLILAENGLPAYGANMMLVTAAIPAGTLFGALMISFAEANPALDMSVIGMNGCVMHGLGDSISAPFSSPGATEVLNLTMPTDPIFGGTLLITQSFTYSPPSTPLGVIASNGLRLIIGP